MNENVLSVPFSRRRAAIWIISLLLSVGSVLLGLLAQNLALTGDSKGAGGMFFILLGFGFFLYAGRFGFRMWSAFWTPQGYLQVTPKGIDFSGLCYAWSQLRTIQFSSRADLFYNRTSVSLSRPSARGRWNLRLEPTDEVIATGGLPGNVWTKEPTEADPEAINLPLNLLALPEDRLQQLVATLKAYCESHQIAFHPDPYGDGYWNNRPVTEAAAQRYHTYREEMAKYEKPLPRWVVIVFWILAAPFFLVFLFYFLLLLAGVLTSVLTSWGFL